MTNELREAAQRALRMALRDMEAIGCGVPESASLVGYFCNRLNEIALTATTNEAAAKAHPGLGGDLQLMLNQGAEYLIAYADILKRGGNDSQAEGCTASAYVITQVIRGELNPWATPQAVERLAQSLRFFVDHPGVSQLCTPNSPAMQSARAALAAQPVQAQGEPIGWETRHVGKVRTLHPVYAPAVDRGLSEAIDLRGIDVFEAVEVSGFVRKGAIGRDVELVQVADLQKIVARALAASAPSQAEPIGNLGPLDPNEGDASRLWAEIVSLREMLKGPPGFTSWQDAAVHERLAKNEALRELKTLAPSQAGSCQASGAELTDANVDRLLSTRIPGGSQARDWFLPHEHEAGLKNVRGVVRAMLREAYALGLSDGAPPAGRTLTDEEIDALIDKWTEGGEWFFHTSGLIMGDKPNRAEFRRLIRLAASSTTPNTAE